MPKKLSELDLTEVKLKALNAACERAEKRLREMELRFAKISQPEDMLARIQNSVDKTWSQTVITRHDFFAAHIASGILSNPIYRFDDVEEFQSVTSDFLKALIENDDIYCAHADVTRELSAEELEMIAEEEE